MSKNQTVQGPIYRVADAAEYIGVSRATLWRLAKQGAIAPPIKITQGATGWPQSALDQWLTERVERGPINVKS